MRQSLAGVLLLLSLAVPSQAEPLRLRGRILSAPADTRIELHRESRGYDGALRQLEGRTEPPVASARPDAGGGFEILVPEPGFFRLVARAEGYLGQQFPLAPLVEDTEVPPVELPRSTPLAVRAVGPDGRPAAGVPLVFSSMVPMASGWFFDERRGTTGEDGRLTLARHPDEEVVLTARDFRVWGLQFQEIGRTASAEVRLGTQRRLTLLVRGEDGRPVPRALAWLYGQLPVALADAAGRMSLVLPPGEVELILEAPDGRRGAVRAKPSSRPEEILEVRLTPPKTVSGKVLDAASGEPLPQAFVWSGQDKPARSGADGAFQIPVSEPGTIQAAAAGYVPAALSSEERPRTGPVALPLARAAFLAGQVVDGEGRPLGGIRLSALPLQNRSLDWSEIEGRSRPDGSFRISGLAAGQPYLLSAKQEGFALATQRVETAPGGKTSPPLRVVLSRGATLLGQLVDEEGLPVPEAEVRLFQADEGGAHFLGQTFFAEHDKTFSDAEGRFRLPGRNAGRYDLSIRHPGFAPASVESIEVPPGAAEVDAGEVRLRAGAVLEGVVVDERGRPVPEVSIHVSATHRSRAAFLLLPDERPAPIETGPDGRFRAADLAAGERFEITAHAEGYPPVNLSGVPAPSEQPVRIVLRAGRTVSGRVLDPDGKPVPGAEIWISRDMSEEFAGLGTFRRSESGMRSDEDGRFRLPHQDPGEVSVAAEAPGFRHQAVGFRIPEDTDPPPVEIRLRTGAALEGRVLDSDGRPLRGAQFHGMPVDPGETSPRLRQTVTDGDGHYRLDGLDEVPHHIQVEHPEHFHSLDQRVEVRPGTNRLDLRFPAGVEVSGRALDEMGNPVAASVALLPVESGSPFIAAANSDGIFRFSAVQEGEFRLTGTAPGFAETTLPGEIQVAGTPVSGLELRLSRGAVIRGRLLGIAPEQAAGASIEAFLLEDGADVRMLGGATYADGGYRVPQAVPGLWEVEAKLVDGRSASGRVRVEEGGEEAVLDLRFEEIEIPALPATPPG